MASRWRGIDSHLAGAGRTSEPGGPNTSLTSVNRGRPRPLTAERRDRPELFYALEGQAP
jgi:hypothetical protein